MSGKARLALAAELPDRPIVRHVGSVCQALWRRRSKSAGVGLAFQPVATMARLAVWLARPALAAGWLARLAALTADRRSGVIVERSSAGRLASSSSGRSSVSSRLRLAVHEIRREQIKYLDLSTRAARGVYATGDATIAAERYAAGVVAAAMMTRLTSFGRAPTVPAVAV